MGGHGGLNILPQKRWNVYNFDNREKVRKDEEQAARDEQIRQQEQRQKESQERLRKLKEATLANKTSHHDSSRPPDDPTTSKPTEDDVEQMKLFEGLVTFQRLKPGVTETKEFTGSGKVNKSMFRGDKELERLYKRAAKEATKVGKDGVQADDEHYRLGYGCLGRDKKRPWYLNKSSILEEDAGSDDEDDDVKLKKKKKKHSESSACVKKQRKSIEELRQERLKREEEERKKTQRLLVSHSIGDQKPVQQQYYNSSFGNRR